MTESFRLAQGHQVPPDVFYVCILTTDVYCESKWLSFPEDLQVLCLPSSCLESSLFKNASGFFGNVRRPTEKEASLKRV